MKSGKELISRELLNSINVLNTLNGGMSEPKLLLQHLENHREVGVSVPGVNNESLQVEIHNNVLSIFYLFQMESNKNSIQIPKFVYSKVIPYFIDSEKITASVDGNYLRVKLPFNKLANGDHRKITINQ